MAGRHPPEELRIRLEVLLGVPPHIPRARSLRTLSSRESGSYRIDELLIEGENGVELPAIFTRPLGAQGRRPAVLYAHAHGNRYEIGKSELIEGRPSLQSPPYGFALAEAGIAALTIDMPTFGARADATESALAKKMLWSGATLFGVMLRELQTGLDVLGQHPDVDPQRIGALGFSMGATHAFWLAALDNRVRAIAHLCCFCDLATLVARGDHDAHGIYMLVPGLVREIATGDIAGLVAPRPQLCCVGLEDPLTPSDAVAVATADVAQRYAEIGAAENWQLLADPLSGHRESPEMRRRVLEFFGTVLRSDDRDGH